MARGRRRRLSEAGYAAIMVALIVPTVGIACAAVAVDTGAWYVEMQMVQKAADAAALAGVPYLPQDLPSARTRALAVASRNGFDNTGNNTVTVELGDKATQLKVTISYVMTNTFGSAIGVKTTTITRSGTADYQGPAPMGSPCNTFGNEPNPGSGGSSATPIGTAQGASPPANCSRVPSLWATIEGPEIRKVQGDRYQTLKCEEPSPIVGVDNCTTASNSNDEYDDFGYVFVVKVQPGAVNKTIDLQIYDPMYVNTGQKCDKLPTQAAFVGTGNANPYVTMAEARDRYVLPLSGTNGGSANATAYCSGDSKAGVGSQASPPHDLTTSFVLRQQTDSQNPETAPVQNDTAGSACIKQYGTFNASGNTLSANVLLSSATSTYNVDVARTYHNWSTLCSFTPPRSGDYYLQVRTNVSMGGTTIPGGAGLIKTGNAAAAATTANTTSGDGTNSFSLRAVAPSGFENQVSVSGYNHMPIYINAPSATATFNLIRVLPGAAGQKISFSYFDAGDASGAGSVTVKPPVDATGSITTTPFPGGCTAWGGTAGGTVTSQTAITNCSAPFTQKPDGTSKNNGKQETITIPIPADYTCNYAAFSGCWYRVEVNFAGATSVTDVTTWDATVVGDPVRLIQ